MYKERQDKTTINKWNDNINKSMYLDYLACVETNLKIYSNLV